MDKEEYCINYAYCVNCGATLKITAKPMVGVRWTDLCPCCEAEISIERGIIISIESLKEDYNGT